MTINIQNLSHPKYRPDIDGLRAIAVICVVVYHAFPNVVMGGFIGVDIFFVISGFLISTIIFENLDKGTFSFTDFYARRIKRIFPALLLVLIACFTYGWFSLLGYEYKQLGKQIVSGAGFISNLVFWSEAGYFDTSAVTKPLLHLWSLGIEEQFYIVWPLLLWLAWKFKFNLFTVTILVAILSFILNLYGVKQDVVATFYSPQTRFWELLSGSLLAWLILYKKSTYHNSKLSFDNWLTKINYRKKIEINGRVLSNAISCLGSILLIYGILKVNRYVNFPGKWALVPVLGTVLIIAAGSNAWVNRTILSNKIVVWFGLISFPLYLWHWPLLSFASLIEAGVPSRSVRIIIIFASVLLAWLTYKFIERPIRVGNHSKTTVIGLVVSMSFVGFVGYNTYANDGLKFRNKVRSTSPFITELLSIDNFYDYLNYKDTIRTGVCHSVSIESFKNNKCLDIRQKNIFSWGDSYAASLYPGLVFVRNNEYPDIGITQMTDGNGPPFYTPGKTDDGKTVIEANNNRLAIVSETKPQIILMTWMVGGWNATTTKEDSVLELLKTIDRIIAVSPNSKIVIIGPFPKWGETLKKQLIKYFNKTGLTPPTYMPTGLESEDSDFDQFFNEKLRGTNNVKYISAFENMCNGNGCLTRVSDNVNALTAVDWGHLTSSGAIILVDKVKSLIFQF